MGSGHTAHVRRRTVPEARADGDRSAAAPTAVALLAGQIPLIPRHRKDSLAAGAAQLCRATLEWSAGAAPRAGGIGRAEFGRQLRRIALPRHVIPMCVPAEYMV